MAAAPRHHGGRYFAQGLPEYGGHGDPPDPDGHDDTGERRGPGRLAWRVLTHNATIGAATIATVLALALTLDFGGGEEPPPGAGDLTANEAAALFDEDYQVDPVTAEAVASAKQRAFEKELEAQRKTSEKKRKARERAKRERERRAAERERRRAERHVPPGVGGSPSGNMALGQKMSAARGWSNCWSSLAALWEKESGWNHRAQNPSSGAYGIPQALPGSKMASAGSDWQTNPVTQIKWGLGYISSRYGNPCSAYGHSQANGWY